MKLKKHFSYNSNAACNFLRKNFLKQENWNNENPVSNFKSFYIVRLGTYDGIPHEILLYPQKTITVSNTPIRALRDYKTGLYTFFKA